MYFSEMGGKSFRKILIWCWIGVQIIRLRNTELAFSFISLQAVKLVGKTPYCYLLPYVVRA